MIVHDPGHRLLRKAYCLGDVMQSWALQLGWGMMSHGFDSGISVAGMVNFIGKNP
jgi:hypothetical protein